MWKFLVCLLHILLRVHVPNILWRFLHQTDDLLSPVLLLNQRGAAENETMVGVASVIIPVIGLGGILLLLLLKRLQSGEDHVAGGALVVGVGDRGDSVQRVGELLAACVLNHLLGGGGVARAIETAVDSHILVK